MPLSRTAGCPRRKTSVPLRSSGHLPQLTHFICFFSLLSSPSPGNGSSTGIFTRNTYLTQCLRCRWHRVKIYWVNEWMSEWMFFTPLCNSTLSQSELFTIFSIVKQYFLLPYFGICSFLSMEYSHLPHLYLQDPPQSLCSGCCLPWVCPPGVPGTSLGLSQSIYHILPYVEVICACILTFC